MAFGRQTDGKAVTADDKGKGLKLLMDMSDYGKGGGWTTKITRAWADCPSAAASFATIEFERTRSAGDETLTIRRYRSTSLVSHTKKGWRLWHIHLSRAD